jgi:PAS domain S-box-containing protein
MEIDLSQDELLKRIAFLEKERDLLNFAMDGSNLGFFNYNFISDTFSVSERLAEILGYSLDEINNISIDQFKELIHPDDKSLVNLTFNNVVSGKITLFQVEVRIRKKNNTWIWILSRAKINRRDENDKPILLSGGIIDLEHRKKIEDELKASETILNEAQRIAKVGNWELDISSNKLKWSNEIFRMFGIDPKIFEESYDAFLNAIHPEDRDRVNNTYNNSLISKRPYKITHRLLMPNGKIKFVEESCETIFDRNDNPIRSLGTVQDITDRMILEIGQKKLLNELLDSKLELESNLYQKENLIEELTQIKEALEISNNEKDKFFSIIAHDLRAPFNGFLGLLEIINNEIDHLSVFELKDYVFDMLKSAENVYELLENLLEWSLIKRNIFNCNPELFNLSLCVPKVTDLLNDQLLNKNINLINELPEEVTVFADLSMVNSLIRNILSNGIKFTNSFGTIWIGLDNSKIANDDETCFYIKDSGIGIPEEIFKNLFKINQKVSRLGTNGECSSGLGLIICKEFVDKNNGKIFVESQEGLGTTFFVILKNKNTIIE